MKFFKPKDSEALTRNLEDFGPQEIEVMHRSDELEQLAEFLKNLERDL